MTTPPDGLPQLPAGKYYMERPMLTYGVEYTGDNLSDFDELNINNFGLQIHEETGMIMVIHQGIPGITEYFPVGTIFSFGMTVVFNPAFNEPIDERVVEVPGGRYKYEITLDNEES